MDGAENSNVDKSSRKWILPASLSIQPFKTQNPVNNSTFVPLPALLTLKLITGVAQYQLSDQAQVIAILNFGIEYIYHTLVLLKYKICHLKVNHSYDVWYG